MNTHLPTSCLNVALSMSRKTMRELDILSIYGMKYVNTTQIS